MTSSAGNFGTWQKENGEFEFTTKICLLPTEESFTLEPDELFIPTGVKKVAETRNCSSYINPRMDYLQCFKR